MLKMLKSKSKNTDKEYPSKLGQKCTDAEDILLLEELNRNIDIEKIAQNHNRTIGGIHCRRRDIAYKMYLKNFSMKEIIENTKLDEESIHQIINKKQNYTSKKITENTPPFSIENEMIEMKNDIKELKNTIKELVEMMKAVYEFEDV